MNIFLSLKDILKLTNSRTVLYTYLLIKDLKSTTFDRDIELNITKFRIYVGGTVELIFPSLLNQEQRHQAK